MAEKFIADKNIHDGHRGRMRAKFLAHGADIFDTYELLEMLLYNVIPYKDTNPIAKRLLCAFGSLDGVLFAEKDELMKVEGIGARAADYITSVSMVSDVLEIEPLFDKSAFSHYQKLGSFFIDYFSNTNNYKISLLLLDNDLVPLSITDLYNCDCEKGNVTARPFISEAVKEQASYAIMAHTHPFTCVIPTDGDRVTTSVIRDSLESIGVMLLDHYIISGDKFLGIIERNDLILAAESKLKQFLDSKRDVISAESTYIEPNFKISNADPDSYEVKYVAKILAPILGEKSNAAALNLYLKYFSFERAMAAPIESLSSLLGERCAFYIKLIVKIESRRQTDNFEFGRIHYESELVNYFTSLFLGEPLEKLYVMTFDTHNRAIACDLVCEGTVNTARITPRRILEVALERKARSVIIAHNHPRGNSTPSSDDTHFTTRLINILTQAKIDLEEHYVVAGNSCSFVLKEKTF